MVNGKKVIGITETIPVGLAIGGLISLAVTLAGAATTAYLVAVEKIGEGSIGYVAVVIAALAGAMGAWGAFSVVKRRRLQICMMSGGVYFALLLSITALFFGGRYQGMWSTGLAILAGCGIVAFFPGKTSRKFHRRKMAYR